MAAVTQASPLFSFRFPTPASRWSIALAVAFFFLSCLAYFPVKFGLVGFVHALERHPALWWLITGFSLASAFFLRLAFPSPGAHAQLQCSDGMVRFIPSRVDRLLAEPVAEAPIPSGSKEVLFCHYFLEELPDDYAVIVRAADGSERAAAIRMVGLLNAQLCSQIVSGIASATGLPVRLVIRRRTAKGTIQESPWHPAERRQITSRTLATTIAGLCPFVAGAIVGYIFPRPAVILALGFAVWITQMLLILAMARVRPLQTYSLQALTSLLTFGAAYGLSIVVVVFIVRVH